MVSGHHRDAEPGRHQTEPDRSSRPERDADNRGEHDEEKHRPGTAEGQRGQERAVQGAGVAFRGAGHDSVAAGAARWAGGEQA